ncbi:ATP-grasp domain-containing protein [Streptomyces sp. AK02-01A]|uniref:preATP grasp domain-containing protein n=1 Tax=Streptomyces sp. AK02-01A TaxID=3028648 RepID=UPI0029BE42FB|nr:ATP-grasp domain-containing protein [Streptomyces sp. AK02-01A]MDX3854830.1 ATP-grasp domain-containing protein [Streptomyces sp. AK02-01A]
MSPSPPLKSLNFLDGVKSACTGDPRTPFVLLGNFEVEDEWARDEVGLPTVGSSASAAIVNRMDEFALLLAGKGDCVVLKSAPDPGYLGYLEGLGLDLPEILVTDSHDPAHTVSADALLSPRLIGSLRQLAERGARLLPHGMSVLEDRLCELTGLTPALPPAALVKSVNSKIYSRRVADELGLPQATGWECETVDEFTAAAEEARASLAAGRRVGVKDAFGVSGKGIMVVEDERRLDQLVRMVARTAKRTGDPRISVVIEEWADKAVDLNYHFTVGRDGSVRFDFVKEALTERGVHKGHRIPARIPDEHTAEIERCATLIGARLAADGFHGVVGVDAIVTADGGLLPVLEINARNNMSTYQTSLQERFMRPGDVALARQYELSLTGAVPFTRLRARLGDLLFSTETGRGLLVNNFATVNAAITGEDAGRTRNGRLYGLLIAGSEAELTELDNAVAQSVQKESRSRV